MKILSALGTTLLFFIGSLQAQLSVTNVQSPLQLVDGVLMGAGITATNVSLNGSPIVALTPSLQLGYFEKSATGFPIPRGVVMSTGNVTSLPGTAVQFSSTNTPYGTDPDLQSIAGVSINDAVVLEFDFVAQGDSMEFRYMFGSEEYPEFAGSNVNDAFGFFLSGPGINGPFTNNAINLALIPGTNTGVSINTVNQNTNSNYYTSNANNVYGTSTKLDGYTVVLVAAAGLQCGQTYHIKMAIGDGGDSIYDSAVFLEAESFKSNAVDIQAESNLLGDFTDTIMAEGCVSTNLNFIRPSYLNDSAQVFFISYSGTADLSDFTNLSDSVYFAPGQDTVSLVVTPIDDSIAESQEFLQISGYSINQCGDTLYDSLILYVVDQYQLTFDLADTVQAMCTSHEPPVVIKNFENSVGPYQFLWSFGDTTNPVDLPNDGELPDTVTHFVTVTDGCGDLFFDSVMLIIDSIIPTIGFFPSTTFVASCIPDSQFVQVSILDSTVGPYIIQWENGASTNSTFLQPGTVNADTSYVHVTLTDACGTEVTDSVQLVTDFEVPNFYMNPVDTMFAQCPSTLLNANVVFGTGTWGPYTHVWSNNQVGDSALLGNNGQIGGEQWHFVTTTNACGMTDVDSVLVVNDFILPEIGFVNGDTLTLDCLPDSGAVQVEMLSNALGPYSYDWDNGDTNVYTYYFDQGANNASFSFEVTLTDACGFEVTKTGVVAVNQTLLIDSLWMQPSAACSPTGILSGFVSGVTPPSLNGLVYQWKGPDSLNADSTYSSVWTQRPSGWYYFTATDTVCSVSDSIYIEIENPPVAQATASPSTGESPLNVVFTNTSQNSNNYYWDFGNGQVYTTPYLDPQSTTFEYPGTYEVMLVAEQGPGCSDTIFLYIEVVEPVPEPPMEDPMFDSPNVFSPNGDGINDVWSMNVQDAKEVDLTILNRWGNVMYRAIGQNPSWDGMTNSGKLANDGVYYYRYIITSFSGEQTEGQGFFHLVQQ